MNCSDNFDTPLFYETLDSRVWTAPSDMASEWETGDLLFGLIRLMKPLTLLETGCHVGTSTVAMVLAIRANQYGHLHTCDTDPAMVETTRSQFGVDDPVTVYESTGVELAWQTSATDFAFLDSSGDRLEEAHRLLLRQGGIVVLHDARRPVANDIERELGWVRIDIASPRGLAIYQKRKP